MPSPPTRRLSNKFRAEPFVNHFATNSGEPLRAGGSGLEPSVSNASGSSGGLVVYPTPAAIADVEMNNEEEEFEDNEYNGADVAMVVDKDVDSSSTIATPRIRDPFRRVSLVSQAAPSIDIQRTSIASNSSSTTTSHSSARRSSYDPNEPGILEKIHTGQGKSKRKPIAVQQWNMMNTFKIRPATGSELASSTSSIPPSIAPDRRISLASTIESPVDEEPNLVFVPEGGLANSLPQTIVQPRSVPIVVPPTTIHSPPVPKSPRKRPRREEPNDPNIQVFYHDDTKPAATTMSTTPNQLVDKTVTPPVDPSPDTHITPPITITAPLPSITSQPGEITTAPIPQALLPTKYDPVDRIFTLPETDPIEKGGPPVKKWTPVYREIRTIGGGACKLPTWTSTGESATPVKPPPDFVPGPLVLVSGASAGNTSLVSGFGGLLSLSQAALGSSTLAPAAASAAGPKRVKKVKSDISLGGGGGGGGSGTVTPLTGGALSLTTTTKRKGPGAGPRKSNKKGGAGTEVPAAASSALDPPVVSVSQASDVDTEMRDA